MWPTWNEPAVAVLAARRVVWRVSAGSPVVSLPAPAGGFEPLQALAVVLADPAIAARGRLALRVDDDWVRLFGVHWRPPVAGETMRRAWLDAELARRFDVDGADWCIESPQSWPGRWSLAAAMPVALHRCLTGAHAQGDDASDAAGAAGPTGATSTPSIAAVRARFTGRRRADRAGPDIVSLLPWSLAEADAALRRAGRGPMLLVGSDAPRRTLLLCERGRPVDAVRLPGAGAPWLQAIEIFRERGHRLPASLPVRVVACRRDEAVEHLLSGRPLAIDARIVAQRASGAASGAASDAASDAASGPEASSLAVATGAAS